MGVIVSKLWRFCLWRKGGEGVGLTAKTRVLEGREFVVIRSKLEDHWVLTLPKDPLTLASGEHFMVPHFSSTESALVVARSDNFDKILVWEEGMPAGSLRREVIFGEDRVTFKSSVEVFEREGSD